MSKTVSILSKLATNRLREIVQNSYPLRGDTGINRETPACKAALSASHSLLQTITGTLGRSFCLIAVLLFAANVVHGQGTSGAIIGRVLDPSGAAVGGAAITITSLETSVTRTTMTGADGAYVISELPLGRYQVKVSASGFKAAIQSPVNIEIKARVRADFQLEIGAQTTVVKVIGGASALLQTDTAETGGLISRTELNSLPIIGRNFLTVATLIPGTSPSVGEARQAALNGAALTVSGSSAEANNVIIDGVSDNEEFSGAMSVVPPIDAIQEFKIQTAQYSAEFGNASGGVVNIALKSGTNQFHGFAYEYLANTALYARPYFQVGPNPPQHSNTFGGGVGGPILRKKIFFFGDYQGTYSAAPFQSLDFVPTAAEKSGDFSADDYIIYDPNTTHPDPANPSNLIRDPFPGNKIPAQRINPITAALLAAYPLPNYSLAGTDINYQANLTAANHLNDYDIRVDDNINPTNVVSGRVSRQTGGIGQAGFLPGHQLDATGLQGGMNASVSYTHIFTPHLFNEAHIGYNYSHYGNQQTDTTNILSQFNIANIANYPPANGFPTFILANMTSATMGRPIASLPTPFNLVENTYQGVDNLTYEKGTHSIKLGAEVSRLYDRRAQGLIGNGYLSYPGEYTSAGVGQVLPTGLADAILGEGDYSITEYVSSPARLSTNRFALYVQDYWRIIPKLTISMGLRYQVNTQWQELHDRVANFDFSSGQFVLPSSVEPQINESVGQLPSTFKYVPSNQVVPKTNWADFAPRLGLSYALTNRIVVRAGAGIFDGVVPANVYSNADLIAPYLTEAVNQGTLETPVNISDGFPAGGLQGALADPTLSGYYTPLHAHTPYAEKWSADIQWSPNARSVLDVGYQGQRSMHSYFLDFYNVATPGPGPLAPRQPYPNVGYVLGYIPVNTQTFNALEISFRQNMSHNLFLYSTYTYSKCYAYTFGFDGGEISNPFNVNYDWGPCDYTPAGKFGTSFVYNIPTINGMSRAGRAILSNWQVSGIYTLMSGLPFTVLLNQDILNVGGNAQNRPNVTGDPNLPSGKRSKTEWFNTSAFSTPALYTFGNEAKNILRGPGYDVLTACVQRGFSLGGSRKAILRMESGNVFNHPNFALPDATYGDANLGHILGTTGGARTVQAVFRFTF